MNIRLLNVAPIASAPSILAADLPCLESLCPGLLHLLILTIVNFN